LKEQPVCPFLLAGDIGGTKAILELFEAHPEGPHVVRHEERQSGDFPSLQALLASFLAAGDVRVRAAVLSVAAPLHQGRGRFTNLPWEMDQSALSRELKIPKVRLINDFVAAVFGILELGEKDLWRLNQENPDPTGMRVVLGAGTGLGLGFGVPRAGALHFLDAWPSEGGHADFAPRSDEDAEIWRFARRIYDGRVGYERLISGSGLSLLYAFYRVQSGFAPPAAGHGQTVEPAEISRRADEGQDAEAIRAVSKFLELLGAFAGNAALQFLPEGGIYLAGGVIIHLTPSLRQGALLDAFSGKGRLSDVVARIPLAVVLNPQLELFGARLCAEQLVHFRRRSMARR
jgi:glucokinase